MAVPVGVMIWGTRTRLPSSMNYLTLRGEVFFVDLFGFGGYLLQLLTMFMNFGAREEFDIKSISNVLIRSAVFCLISIEDVTTSEVFLLAKALTKNGEAAFRFDFIALIFSPYY